MEMTVTVSIPVYNGEKFILEALQSVINQTVKVNEIIICDNCSNDKTVDIVKDFIIDHDKYNIKLILNSDNIGFQMNFVRCYNLAKTDFLVILHADDLLKYNTIEKQLNFFKHNSDYGIVGGKGDIINEKGEFLIKRNQSKDLLFKRNEIYEFIKETSSYILFSTVMYNLKLLENLLFIEEKSIAPDELYWPKVLKIRNIAVLGESLILNRRYSGQMHNQNAIFKFDDYIFHLKKKINRADLESNIERKANTREIIKKQVSQISITLGRDSFMYFRKYNITLKYFIYAFKFFPGIIFTKYFLRTIGKMLSIIK